MRIFLVAAILLTLSAFRPNADREAGRAAALADIRAGKLILRTYGFAAGANMPYPRLLEERLGVRTVAVAGCVVSPRIVAETAAYNDVMTREIRKRFGPRVLEELQEEAARVNAPRQQATSARAACSISSSLGRNSSSSGGE